MSSVSFQDIISVSYFSLTISSKCFGIYCARQKYRKLRPIFILLSDLRKTAKGKIEHLESRQVDIFPPIQSTNYYIQAFFHLFLPVGSFFFLIHLYTFSPQKATEKLYKLLIVGQVVNDSNGLLLLPQQIEKMETKQISHIKTLKGCRNKVQMSLIPEKEKSFQAVVALLS